MMVEIVCTVSVVTGALLSAAMATKIAISVVRSFSIPTEDKSIRPSRASRKSARFCLRSSIHVEACARAAICGRLRL